MNFKTSLLLTSLLLTTSCSFTAKTTPSSVGSSKIKTLALELANIDKKVRPQDDFFYHVNGSWIKKAKIPADKTSWGAFHQLRDLTEHNSLALLDELLVKKYSAKSENRKIQQLYALYMNMDKRNEQGIEPIQPLLNKISKIKNIAQLQKMLISTTKNEGFNPLYSWTTFADLNDSSRNAVYLDGPELGLGKDYFQKDNPRNTEVIIKYTDYVAKLLQKIGHNKTSANKIAKQIVAFEKQLAQDILTNEQERDPNLINNQFKTKQLAKTVKNIDLASYLLKAGVNTKNVIVTEKNYYTKMDSWLKQDNLDLLKNFLQYKVIAQAVDYLDDDLSTQSFAFYQQYLQGQKEQRNLQKRALSFIDASVGEAFGKIYVKKYFSKKSKKQMLQLIDYLQKSFENRIKQLTWMSEQTKQKALIKLASFNSKVGFPDKWEDYSKLDIDGEASLYANVKTIQNWAYKKQLKKIGKKVDKKKWGMTPQTVNAYYNPLNNEIVFPAAILQSPFFNPKADPAINFGAIGAVIGHEMTHGFDDSGANFDAKGNLVNWWTPQDKQKFEAATEKLSEQYSQYQPVQGHFVNGKFTLGENIADLGGVTIAYDALQMYLKDNGDIAAIDNYSQQQRFFMSWATVWRIKSTKEALINQVKTDPHSPGCFRVLGSLTNVDAFYESFEVKAGDKMYKQPKQRIKIW